MRETDELERDLAHAAHHTRSGQWSAADSLLENILRTSPEHAAAWEARARLAWQQKQPRRTVEHATRAVAVSPASAPVHLLLARAYKALGLLQPAVRAVREALRLDPREAAAHVLLGQILTRQDRFAAAGAALAISLQLAPESTSGHVAMAALLHRRGQLDAALAHARRAMALSPQDPAAHAALGFFLAATGDLDASVDSYQKLVALAPDDADAHTSLISAQHLHPDYTPRALFDELVRWREQHAVPLRGLIQAHLNDRSPERPLRIGFVSPDFRFHAASFFLRPLLAHLDRSQFHVTAYANVEDPDATTVEFKALVDRWRDIAVEDDDSVAQLIREDRIDVLVDGALHVSGHRLRVFAQKPAPVQVSWLGYLGSSGLDTIDYLLLDPYLNPPAETGPWCSEQPCVLPETWCCYDPAMADLAIGGSPAIATGHVTFGAFHRGNKINARLLALWARTVAAVPNSRLIMLCLEGSSRQRALAAFTSHGIDPARVEFVSALPRAAYLAQYGKVDIALDAFPHNGHTTTCDALWMGVPVLTLCGTTLPSRAGLSLLTNAGLAEWIANTEADFVARAARLAGDLPALAAFRVNLGTQFRASPVMDAPRFARHVETAFRTMWREWCTTSSPA